MRVSKAFEFDSAHYLPGYDGKCANLHGHRWKIMVEFKGAIQENGMVIDFTVIKQNIQPLIDRLDHNCLNDLLQMPTAENIAKYIAATLRQAGQTPSRIEVWETPSSCAEWRREEDGL